jgi:hypothetical protein
LKVVCSEAVGHPEYGNGRPEDPTFADGELLYRRYRAEHFQYQRLLPSAFKFPRQSFNRQKYSQPDDVLHPDCCDGKDYDGWGVLECSSSELPTPIDLALATFSFQVVHQPKECCYAHTELWCKRGHQLVDEPSKTVKETFRVKLALKMRVRITASV